MWFTSKSSAHKNIWLFCMPASKMQINSKCLYNSSYFIYNLYFIIFISIYLRDSSFEANNGQVMTFPCNLEDLTGLSWCCSVWISCGCMDCIILIMIGMNFLCATFTTGPWYKRAFMACNHSTVSYHWGCQFWLHAHRVSRNNSTSTTCFVWFNTF